MTTFLGVALFVLALMVAIFLHEGGHFATAKLFGMKVERFFLGFGPTIWSFRRGETEYGIKALPLGGFCKIAGMSPYESDSNFLEEDRAARRRAARAGGDDGSGGVAAPPRPEETDPSRMFRNKPAWQRAIVLAAGSFTHFVVALVLIWVVLVAIGIGTGQATTTIQRTVPTTQSGASAPAQAAGLRSGDRIVAIDGRRVGSFEELRAALADKGGDQITVTYVRDGQEHETTLMAADENGRGFLGFQPTEQTRRVGPIAALPQSADLFWDTTVATVKGLGGLVSGIADRMSAPQPAPGAGGGGGGGDGTGGPIGIVGITRLAGQAVASNQWAIFVAILIQLNIVVGVFNLLPLPPMDGGYLAFLGWQVVTRREVDLRKVVPVAALIVGLLVMLTVGLVWLDITNPVPDPFR
ncbi:MAG TPA: M50 family metallopeptidase [Actinomycetes bacterium]|nr:M50 family metallopeptidase [Actinomycetes bacterium]